MKESTLNFLLAMTAISTPLLVILVVFTYWKLKNQSQTLQIKEQYYRSLFEQNPDPVLTFNLDGILLSANEAVKDFGFQISDLLNRPFTAFLVPSEVEHTVAHFIQACNGTATTYDCKMYDKEGKLREISATNIPIYLHGEITGVYGIIKDITKHKQALRSSRSAEAKYRSLVENSLVGVYIIQDEQFVYVNPRLCEMGGYSRDEMLSMEVSKVIYPEDFPLVKENIIKLITNVESSNTFQYRAFKKDRTILSLEVYGSAIEFNGRQAIIGTVIDITERVKTEQIIKHMAYHDQLTGLPNRYLFREELEAVVRNSKLAHKQFALLFMDIDRFKEVNDTFGHELGDRLLIKYGMRLKDCIQEEDVISRYGGDEFAIILPDSDQLRAREVAERIIARFSSALQFEELELFVTPSIGISIYPNDGDCFDALIKNADLAMYYAKQHNKKNIQFYNMELSKLISNEELFGGKISLRRPRSNFLHRRRIRNVHRK